MGMMYTGGTPNFNEGGASTKPAYNKAPSGKNPDPGFAGPKPQQQMSSDANSMIVTHHENGHLPYIGKPNTPTDVHPTTKPIRTAKYLP